MLAVAEKDYLLVNEGVLHVTLSLLKIFAYNGCDFSPVTPY